MAERRATLLKWIEGIQAIAQNGLAYTDSDYDRERYEQLRSIAAEMAAGAVELPEDKIREAFEAETGYATPKLDVRGVCFREGGVLLVREAADGKWTLPGGWADVNTSPAESAVREIKEESGYDAEPVKLLALYDKRRHGHPHQIPHAYKAFFLCRITGGAPETNHETSGVAFFKENEIPELSAHRVVASQIKRFFEHSRHPDWPADFD